MKLTAEEFEMAKGSSRVCMVSQLSWDYCAIPLISKLVSVCEVGLHCCILDSSWFTCNKAHRGAEIMTHSILESIHSILNKGSTQICILLVDFCQAFNTVQRKRVCKAWMAGPLAGEIPEKWGLQFSVSDIISFPEKYIFIYTWSTRMTRNAASCCHINLMWQHEAAAWRDNCSVAFLLVH